MPSKKKKFNARFPPARIKKIMQTDEDVGKVAAPVPVIISRALELFIESLIVKSSNITKSRHAKTLSTAHIKHTILSEKRFDFLKDLVANIADVQTEDDGLETTATVSGRSTEMEPRRRVRGRPRKKKADVKLALKSHLKRQKRLDEDPDTEETDTATEEPASDDVDDDEDDEEDGDTETDPDVHDNPNITDSSSVKYISDNSSEPKASCSKMDVNAYPKSEAHSGPDAQQPNQQVCSLDLRMNQNKPDMIGRSESTAHGSTTHAIVTCQGLTHPGGIGLGQYPHLAASSSGVMNCWPGGWSELIAQPHTTVLAQSDVKPSTGENPGQSNNRSSSVSQQGASPNAEKAGNNNQFNRPSGNQNSEVAPKSDSLGNVISTQENMFPMYGAGMPATSMPFYPHPVGVVQQMAPYPAHMRPMQGMMPSYQAVPHASHMMMPQVIDLRYGLPNMNSTPVPAVQSVYSESARTDQPPPAHSKHNTPQQHVDKTEHTAS